MGFQHLQEILCSSDTSTFKNLITSQKSWPKLFELVWINGEGKKKRIIGIDPTNSPIVYSIG